MTPEGICFSGLIISTDIDARSYIPPVQLGEVMRGVAIGVVKASRSDKFAVGALATGMTGWAELAVVKDSELSKVMLPKNGRLTDALSVLGTLPFSSLFLHSPWGWVGHASPFVEPALAAIHRSLVGNSHSLTVSCYNSQAAPA